MDTGGMDVVSSMDTSGMDVVSSEEQQVRF
jgi:hypothetical protein